MFSTITYQVFDLTIKMLAGISAIIIFIVGLRQYQKGQHWQKAQILLSLIDSFENDKRIEAACAMLDWDERDVSLGENTNVQFSNDMLVSALRVVEMDAVFTTEESFIRDAFDAFFDFFYKLYTFQKTGLLAFADYMYFFYWLELIRNVGVYKKNEEIKKVIHKYIDTYRFIGMQQLLEEYSRSPELIPVMKGVKG